MVDTLPPLVAFHGSSTGIEGTWEELTDWVCTWFALLHIGSWHRVHCVVIYWHCLVWRHFLDCSPESLLLLQSVISTLFTLTASAGLLHRVVWRFPGVWQWFFVSSDLLQCMPQDLLIRPVPFDITQAMRVEESPSSFLTSSSHSSPSNSSRNSAPSSTCPPSRTTARTIPPRNPTPPRPRRSPSPRLPRARRRRRQHRTKLARRLTARRRILDKTRIRRQKRRFHHRILLRPLHKRTLPLLSIPKLFIPHKRVSNRCFGEVYTERRHVHSVEEGAEGFVEAV